MSIINIIISSIIILSTFGGANYYVARRLYQSISIFFPHINTNFYILIYIFIILAVIIGFMGSLLPLPVLLRNILSFISSYWLGIFVYLLLFFIVSDIILLLGSTLKVIPPSSLPNVRFHAKWIVIMLTIGVVSYGIYNARQIKHVSYDISLRENSLKNKLNLVVISDLHLGAINSEHRLAQVVQEINNLNADLVCIAGDIFDNDYYALQNHDETLALLKSITATYGVYASLGNHDAGKTVPEMIDFLKKSGITLLTDNHAIIDDRLILVGRLDASPIGGFGNMNRKDLQEVIEPINSDLPIIVMEHNPTNISEYENEVDLILSGHTHKGQLFPVGLLTKLIFTVDYGYYQKNSDSPHVVVTSGVGTWGMPMRVGTNCEIVSIKLH